MSQKNKGIILIIMSAFFFALMNMMVRLAGDLPSIEKSFFRNFVAVFFALIALKRSNTPVHVPKGQLKNLLMRSVCGTLGILCNYYAIDHLMLADASILNKLSPFFAILFSFILLKEKIHPFAAGCVFIAFVGSLFIIKPGFASVTALPAFVGLLGGMGAGIAYTYVRKLGTNGVKGPFIVLFFSAFSCIVTLPYLIFDFHPMTLAQLGCLLLAGLLITHRLSSPPSLDFCFLDRFRTCGVLLDMVLSSPLLLRCSCSTTERECSLSFFRCFFA